MVGKGAKPEDGAARFSVDEVFRGCSGCSEDDAAILPVDEVLGGCNSIGGIGFEGAGLG